MMPRGGILKAWIRFLLLVLPRAATGRYSATRMTGYAIAFASAGIHGIAGWCLTLAVGKCKDDPFAFERALGMLLDTGQVQLAARLANAVFDLTGVMPGEAIRLTGEFHLGGADAESVRMLDRVIEALPDDPASAVPAPVSTHGTTIQAVRHELSDERHESAELSLTIARLCFRFSAFDTAAKLFDHSELGADADIEDQIAHAYSLLRCGEFTQCKAAAERFGLGLKAIDVNPDWRILQATVMFAFGWTANVRSAVRSCLRSRYSAHSEFEQILEYGDQIVDMLARFPDRLAITSLRHNGEGHEPSHSDLRSTDSNGGRHKIFVCGNGWSGSGALVDALADFDTVVIAPDMPIDRFINQDTNNELMFVQGGSGLGRLWRGARDNGHIDRMDLWELFRGHVLGMGAIGYTEHKSANAAAALLDRHGHRYIGEFRNALVALTGLDDHSSLEELRSRLVSVTEALTELIFDAGNGQCVAFNNVMFGANLDMVEIFSDFKLAVVVRDPLDQYADRRQHDLKHWMSARRFVSFYKSGRNAFHNCREKLPDDLASRVREVEFEHFVRDAGYRDGVLNWLLDDLKKERVSGEFDPEKSSGNIGIYKTLLTQDEIDLLDGELREWRSH